MLLSMMRKHAKSWLIKTLIAIIAIVFIFYFGYSFRSREAVKIAEVNGEIIGSLEYQKAYGEAVEAMRAQYRDLFNEELIKSMNLKARVLQDLIDQKLITQEAKKLGLEVTKPEIQQAIMAYPAFQVGGRFDLGRYNALLGHNRMRPEDFEASMAQDLLRGKIRQFLTAFLPVTEQEMLDYYGFANESVSVALVHFDPAAYRSGIQPQFSALEEHFKGHREAYRVPEKIKVAYLALDAEAHLAEAKVKEQDMRVYYDAHRDEFKVPKQVRARHILFRVPQSAGEEQEKAVREKAKKVLEEARAGKDFATLAKLHSQDASGPKGGDLGYFSQGQMVESFEKAAFQLKAGEVSDLVRSPFGYHIIRVEDVREERIRPFDEVREEIGKKLMRAAASEIAYEKGLSLADQIPYETDLVQFGKEHGLEARFTTAFSADEPIPGIGGTRELRQTLFTMDDKETSDLTEIGGKFYIFQRVDRQTSYLPELDGVKDRVKEDVITAMAAEKAKTEAGRYLEELRGGKDWNTLAKERGIKIEETGYFTRRGPIPKIGYERDLIEAAFSLTESSRYPSSPFVNPKGAYVIRWMGRQGIDPKKFEEEREKYRFLVMQVKQARVYENWLDGLRQEARIEMLRPMDRL
jgi:peptidyl-prolyl cis-trans isomerase D